MSDAEYRRREAEKARAYKARQDAHNQEVRERERRQAEEARRLSSGGGSSCFAGGTMIKTVKGERPIETLSAGDEVLAYSPQAGEFVPRPVRQLKSHAAARIWEVNIEGTDSPLRTTGLHVFLTECGWRRARQLRPGMKLQTESGWRQVASIQKTEISEPVFNLVVEDLLTFVAGGVVAHSFAHLRRLRAWLHRWTLQDGLGSRLLFPLGVKPESVADCT